MLRSFKIFLILAQLLLFHTSLNAQSISLNGSLYPDHRFINEENGIIEVYIFVNSYSTYLLGIEFSAPPPECLSGATLIEESTPFIKIGSIETGVKIAFGSCYIGAIHVMTLKYYSVGIDSCCPYKVMPHSLSISGDIEAYGCSIPVPDTVYVYGETSTVIPEGMTGCGGPTIPSNPSPPDGAINQPLIVTMR